MPYLILVLCMLVLPLWAKHEPPSLQTLYNSLDPLSLSQLLAFYELYPDTLEGKRALEKAWKLLTPERKLPSTSVMHLPKPDIQAVVSLVTREKSSPPIKLPEEQLLLVEQIGKPLANRRLKGASIWSREELLRLPPEEIDLARGLLLCQFDNPEEGKGEIRQYEATLDLMAFQILAHLPPHPTAEDKVREINRFIFQEMRFRFPPHSLHAKDIDLYTFLPSVLDSRQGVCLGVSILYLSLAQRLDLPLEIITPPGHIYIRYRDEKQLINIETTARGVNTPSETYLGINTRKLETRNIKEVIGLAFINQASVAWGKENYKTTLELYQKALPFVPEDPLLKMFLGFNYLFAGKTSQGKALLQQIRSTTFDYAVSPETIPEDYLEGKVDPEGIKILFLPVDETRTSIVEKQKKLQKILSRYPHFRAGLLQLATTWLQLGRQNEALEILERYHKIDPANAIVEYYLAMLSLERLDFNHAWEFLKHSESIAEARDHHPRALKAVRHQLRRLSPDPEN